MAVAMVKESADKDADHHFFPDVFDLCCVLGYTAGQAVLWNGG